MDLKSGYYQIEMEECDKSKTAFVCPLGFSEFNRMPQGITNAASTFQRLMEKCMGDINLKEVLVFLDDPIVFSSTLEEHKARLLHVLQRLRENGLKLSPEKCRFFQISVCCLEHVVSRDGVETDPDKASALKTWPRPQTLKELKSFLGFASYYCRFVRDYSKIVKPLNNLTLGYPPQRKGQKMLTCKEALMMRRPISSYSQNHSDQLFSSVSMGRMGLDRTIGLVRSEVTGFSPYDLMFGQQTRLPVDIAFRLPVNKGNSGSYKRYTGNLKSCLEESYQIAIKNSQKIADRNKVTLSVQESTLEEGEVLVRNVRLRNKHKLANNWESTVYQVLKRMGDLPVYVVHPVSEEGPTRTLHRDLLLPFGYLSEPEEDELPEPRPARLARTRRSHPQLQDGENSEPEDDFLFCPVEPSVIPEQRFTKVFEIPKNHPLFLQ
ncbi:hypothetical protein SKAU_G00020940 [Synaphobranchus kaupii]|uniref:ribonuclease H n=1 Tax=Synaphobranchus kaupii TaxID=118154 RepID=A0A9Q1GBS2_SYNKA|nr:hypothetical protein SKAU_G00020940 [Synaphobranchus kaupii]